MADLTPSDALTTCERALRQLFGHAYAAAHGKDWLSEVASAEDIADWRGKREVEQKRRGPRGVLEIPSEELAYADFYDLCAIAKKNWEPLSRALGKRGEMLPLLERFDRLRNTVAHSRPLLGFEQDLLSGIAGEIRNRATIYMTEQDASGDYYPRIESAMDSYGREIVGTQQVGGAIVSGRPITVGVGDVVTFECVGSDAQERELTWTLAVGESGRQQETGDSVSLRWIVTDDDLQDVLYAKVTMQSNGKYRRHRFYDDAVNFDYRVLPPT